MSQEQTLLSAASAYVSHHRRGATGDFTFQGQRYFVKSFSGESAYAEMRHAQLGLEHLAKAVDAAGCSAKLRIPRVFHAGQLAGAKYSVVMEFLDMSGGDRRKCAATLGDSLACVHMQPLEVRTFGFPVDGFCGEGVQLNNAALKEISWVQFWRDFRLQPQLDQLHVLRAGSVLEEKGKRLSKQLGELFAMMHVEDIQKSCLHGDLWSGNWSGLKTSREDVGWAEVTMFDPACYYGHHEADLGIAHMFGMPKAFFDAYHNRIPKQPGFEQRALLYELHHHLNHANIFGTAAYGAGAEALLDRLLSTMNRRG